MGKTYIIAEAGVNHNGDIDLAKKMITVAADAGADAVKFQTFITERGISKFAPKAEYQKKRTGDQESQFEMVKRWELDKRAHKELIDFCQKLNILFLSTPFDLISVDLLVSLGLKIFKIPSGEITNMPYLKKVGSLKKEIIMSTGMADLKEIENALNILKEAGSPRHLVTLLQCNTEYPTPYEDANLLGMLTIKDVFKVKVGYSDHTLGIEVPVAAVALGATIIEKHFTLDNNMEGPDHRASIEPDGLKAMVRAIRNIEKALGDGVKKPSASELKNRDIARKSIVASKDIIKGDLFTESNLEVKRPGTGISAMEWGSVIGKTAKRDFMEDELIEL